MSEGGWEPSVELLDTMMDAWLVNDGSTRRAATLSEELRTRNREVLAVVLKSALTEMREETLIRVIRAQVYQEQVVEWGQTEEVLMNALKGGGLSEEFAYYLKRMVNNARSYGDNCRRKVIDELRGTRSDLT